MSKVALISTNDRSEGVQKSIDLLDINPVENKEVVLKPNFNTADPVPGSTSIETLKSLITKLYEMNMDSITLAERSGPANTAKVFKKKRIHQLAEELDFSIVNLSEVPIEDFVRIQLDHSHWEDGFLFAKIYREADCIMETCCLKTHQYGGNFTLSLKNAVGMVPRRNLDGSSYMSELHSSPHQRKMIAEINAAFEPALIVLDGVTAFVDGGPAAGTRKNANVMLASTDRIALDAVGVAILRILGTTSVVSEGKVFEQEQIKRAVELGLGASDASEIELLPASGEEKELANKIRNEFSE